MISMIDGFLSCTINTHNPQDIIIGDITDINIDDN